MKFYVNCILSILFLSRICFRCMLNNWNLCACENAIASLVLLQVAINLILSPIASSPELSYHHLYTTFENLILSLVFSCWLLFWLWLCVLQYTISISVMWFIYNEKNIYQILSRQDQDIYYTCIKWQCDDIIRHLS